MINDAFSAIVHGEYRRQELLAAAMLQTPTPRRARGVGAQQLRSLLLRVRQSVGHTLRVGLHAARS